MRFILHFLLVLLFAVAAQAAPTATTKHAKVTLVSEAQAITPGESFDVAFDFELEEHWHIYWKNPGDSGLAPSIFWELPSGFAVGSIQWPTPKAISIEGLTNYGYEGSPSLIQKFIPPSDLEGEAYSQEGNEVILRAKLEWLICKEVCIPESAEVSLTLPISDSSLRDETAFQSRRQNLPLPLTDTAYYESKEEAIYLQLPYKVADDAYFYPDVGGIIAHNAEQRIINIGTQSVLKLQKDTMEVDGALGGVLTSGSDSFALQAEAGIVNVPAMVDEGESESSLTLVAAILFAILGGLLLNIMPCVFPVLSLKALSVVKKAEKEPQQVRRQGLAYLVGVLASFLTLGLLMIALKSTGQTLGWGFQLQSPIFVTGMILVFFLLGLSLIGMFHLPVLMGTAAYEAEKDDSLKGSFLTGVLAVLVATPCAVPFMAPAVGYAFAQTVPITLLIMLALGFGLALPYLLLTWLPALHRKLPKPGAWMNTFKEFMAFPMFASAAWLLWVLTQQVSLDNLAIVLAVLVLLAFLIWLKKRLANWLAFGLVAALMFSLYTETQSGMADAYKELSEPFNAQRLTELRAEGKSVFVNATAAWCITCKVNERIALRDEAFIKTIKEQDITYMVADWTNYDNEITQWLERYQRSGVPLYVYYPSDGGQEVVLPQLLTTSIILDSLKEK